MSCVQVVIDGIEHSGTLVGTLRGSLTAAFRAHVVGRVGFYDLRYIVCLVGDDTVRELYAFAEDVREHLTEHVDEVRLYIFIKES